METEAESIPEPGRVADDVRKEPMALVADGFARHTKQSTKKELM